MVECIVNEYKCIHKHTISNFSIMNPVLIVVQTGLMIVFDGNEFIKVQSSGVILVKMNARLNFTFIPEVGGFNAFFIFLPCPIPKNSNFDGFGMSENNLSDIAKFLVKNPSNTKFTACLMSVLEGYGLLEYLFRSDYCYITDRLIVSFSRAPSADHKLRNYAMFYGVSRSRFLGYLKKDNFTFLSLLRDVRISSSIFKFQRFTSLYKISLSCGYPDLKKFKKAFLNHFGLQVEVYISMLGLEHKFDI